MASELGSSFTAVIAAATIVGIVTWAVTGLVLRLLRQWAVLDHPNDRSSHRVPTPRGGGLAVIGVIGVAWLVLGLTLSYGDGLPAAGAVALAMAALFWRDDVHGLPVIFRLAAQVFAVTTVLLFAPPEGLVFGGLLPPFADLALTALAWLWFINLCNFMDGIDGISGVETASIGVGVAIVTVVAGLSTGYAVAGLTLAAAAAGFLIWNWHPARIFLGDVGSIPLGFLLGWVLIEIAAHGQLVAALILPAYYLVDASWTLSRRLVRGEKVWRAHKQHLFQRAVARGMSHASVSRHIFAANLILIGLAALAATGFPVLALAGTAAVIIGLIMRFSGPEPRRSLDALDSSAVGKAERAESGANENPTNHEHRDIRP